MRRRRRGTGAAPARPRIGLFGILGSGNIGNDASVDAVIRFLHERHPEAQLGFFAMGPAPLEERYGAPATPLQWYEAHVDSLGWLPDTLLKILGRLLDPIRTIRWVHAHDVVIVPGMGVLETTTPSRPWGLPYSLLSLAVAGRLCGTRVALVCVGAETIPDGLTRRLLMGTARLAHYRSYRDALSRSAMEQMGLDVRSDGVYPDLAFALPVPVREPARPRSVAVGLMNFQGAEADRPRARELHEAYVERMTRFVGQLVAEGRQVRLVAGDQEDEPVLQRVWESTRQTHGSAATVVIDRAVTFQELMETMAEVEVVVATRYHNVLAALHLSIPTLSVSYARKSDVLMATMGLGEFCHPAARMDLDRLSRQFQQLDARREELAAVLRRENDAHARAVGAQLEALSAFLHAAVAAEAPPAVPVPVGSSSRRV